MIELKKDEKEWLRLKWLKIRKSQQTADQSSNNWNRINGEINRYLDESGERDVVQRTKIKSESLALKDALEVGKWHSAEAERHIADVQLFLQMKELGVL
jgi:hypothetical protein